MALAKREGPENQGYLLERHALPPLEVRARANGGPHPLERWILSRDQHRQLERFGEADPANIRVSLYRGAERARAGFPSTVAPNAIEPILRLTCLGAGGEPNASRFR